MRRKAIASVLGMGFLLVAALTARAGEPAGGGEGPAPSPTAAPAPATLTGGFFGLASPLEEAGLVPALRLTEIGQACLRGGRSTAAHPDRQSGSLDLFLDWDASRAGAWAGLSAHLRAESSWNGGIEPREVETMGGANADAAGDRAADITELWLEQELGGGLVTLRAGKIDLACGFACRHAAVAFDNNAYANDETAQFLNGVLVNNPAVPFPDRGLGASAILRPGPWGYLSAGLADASADGRETGLATAFGGEGRVFAIGEAGTAHLLPGAGEGLPGALRLGVWSDSTPQERFDGGKADGDGGCYLSADQFLWPEREAGDGQGLGVFARAGWAEAEVRDIARFFSAGLQYQGLLPGRDNDVLALGWARSEFSGPAGFAASAETVLEAYYLLETIPGLRLAPALQWIGAPGGNPEQDEALVLGLRLTADF